MGIVTSITGSNAYKIKQEELAEDLIEVQKEMFECIEYVDKYTYNRGTLGGLDWGNDLFNKAFDGLNPGLILIAAQPNVGNIA